MRKLNKLITPPPANSRPMRAYMQAILETTGLMAGESFKISCFMGNYRTHIENNRLIKHSNEIYSLTEIGRKYFISRLTDEPITRGQLVSRAEVLDMINKITADSPATGWIQIETIR